MDKKKVSLKGSVDQKRAISYLEDLVKSFKEGTICVQQGSNFVTLKPGQSVDLEIHEFRPFGFATQLNYTR